MPKVLNVRDVGRSAPNAVYVGRPSKWGNPYVIDEDGDRDEVIRRYRTWLRLVVEGAPKFDLNELRGKDLICWCAPLPCHADILLELANKES